MKLSTKLGLCLVKVLHAREKKRKKDRKREKENGKGRGEPARAERTEKKERERSLCCTDLPRRWPVLQTQSQGSKEDNPSRPQEEKRGKKKEKEGRRRKTEPETGPPKTPEPENGDKTPYILYRIPYKSRTPHQTKPHPRQITEFAAQNPPEKRAVTKIELRKNKPQKRRTFCRRFRDEKQGFLGPKNLPEKNPDSRSEFVAKNSPKKNLRRT